MAGAPSSRRGRRRGAARYAAAAGAKPAPLPASRRPIAGTGWTEPDYTPEARLAARASARGERGWGGRESGSSRGRNRTAEGARQFGMEIAKFVLQARQQTLWGEGSTAVASDSTHFGAFDQNIFTEWHSRYGGRGVLIYWHVERGSVVIHSQRLNCSASEVHAMVDGAIRHGTQMQVEASYVDTHGQSEIGFAITKLLGFDLLPRIKRINTIKMYRPATGEPDPLPRLAPPLTPPLHCDRS